jgi:tetratricopeptide (TPR) repeat protein
MNQPQQELAAEVEELWQQGELPAALRAWSQHPEWRLRKPVALDLAYEDYCQRLEAGEALDPNAFCARFPSFQTSLRRLLEAHHFVAENSHLLADFQPVPWPEAGESFLGFVLARELGRGAFARVFLATEPALGQRQVAVKISLHGAAEAETLGRFNHPNIVPVHSVQTDPASGLTVVCMPYLGCATLCDVLDHAFAHPDRPAAARVILDAAQDPSAPAADRASPAALLCRGTYVDGICHLAAQLTDALASVHALGICHRDLKPSNVLLTPDGRPMLLDFNLSGDRQAPDARLGGTLPYMAPEQLLATDPDRPPDAGLIDARSDLFSLGMIVYELLTGTFPFGPIPLELPSQELRQHLLERQRSGLRPVRLANPHVDRARARLIERCLAYDPKDRPQSAAEVAVALRHSLSRLQRARRWAVVHWRKVLAASIPVAAVCAASGALLSSEAEHPAELHVVSQPVGAQWHLKQGQDAYDQGRYQETIEHCDRALKAEPKLASALLLEGRAYQQLGDFRKALDDYEAADQRAPDGQTKARMGYCWNRRKRHAEAIEQYNKAIAAGLELAAVYNNLGYSYLQVSQLDKAVECLDKAVRLDPRLQAAYHNRARACGLRALHGNDRAIPSQVLQDIDKAWALGPKTMELADHAAWLYAEAARQDKSRLPFALNYVAEAIRRGKNPQIVAKDPTFDVFRDHWAQEVGRLAPLRAVGPLIVLPVSPYQVEAAATYLRYQTLLTQPGPNQSFQSAIRLVDPCAD